MKKYIQDFNSKYYLNNGLSTRKKTVLSLIFILSLVGFYFIVSTNGFFNLGMKFSSTS